MRHQAVAVARVRDRVFAELRREIIGLQLPPGTPISENELASRLGASRTPVREALLLLADEGLVEVFPKIGTFVSRVDLQRVTEAQFLREAVELESLRTLPAELDPLVVASLRENLSAQLDHGDDLRTFFDLDEAFHRGLMTLARHEVSWSVVQSAKGHLDRARMLGIQHVAGLERFVTDHRAVLSAVLEGETDTAVHRLREHLRVVFEDVQVVHQRSPDLFVGDDPPSPRRRSAYIL